MKFAEIIREAGLNPKDFPTASNISIVLYNGKSRVDDETIHYVESLFAHNDDSLERFKVFLRKLEKDPISSMNIMIDEYYVVLNDKSSKVRPLSRKPPLDPLDYME